MEYKDVFKNKYGYYELKNQPTREHRKEVFEKEYFQQSMACYSSSYTSEEKKFRYNKLQQKEYIIRKHMQKSEKKCSFLDLGCGEGFALKYFYDRGYDVTGIDYSSCGLEFNNKDMLKHCLLGAFEDIIPTFIEQSKVYDIINMDYVLDMVINPKEILELINSIMDFESVLCIKVGNQYSILQEKLLNDGKLKKDYWLDKDGHPSYFNRQGLINLMNDTGFECVGMYGESFVDFNLINDLTNYYEDKSVGKKCYMAKVELENLMHELSMEKSIEIYRLLGEMGLGREMIGIFKKVDNK